MEPKPSAQWQTWEGSRGANISVHHLAVENVKTSAPTTAQSTFVPLPVASAPSEYQRNCMLLGTKAPAGSRELLCAQSSLWPQQGSEAPHNACKATPGNRCVQLQVVLSSSTQKVQVLFSVAQCSSVKLWQSCSTPLWAMSSFSHFLKGERKEVAAQNAADAGSNCLKRWHHCNYFQGGAGQLEVGPSRETTTTPRSATACSPPYFFLIKSMYSTI